MAPMVHWPEVMVTYCPEHKVLFSADAFGTFGALNGGILDSSFRWTISGTRCAATTPASWANTAPPYRKPSKTERPSHRNDLLDARPRMAAGNRARNRYLRSVESLRRRTGCGDRLWFDVWQYGPDGRENRSGAGRTGCKNIIVYNLSYADISNVIRDIFKYDTLIVGSPTYNGELFPEVGSLLQKSANVAFPAGNSPISAPIPGLEQRYACWENSPRK